MKLMRIYELRKECGMTQKQLAAEMGVMQNAVSNWENETYLPRTRQLPALAKLLGVPIGDLFSNEMAQAG